MISPCFQIKPMNAVDNLVMDNSCESDEDLPLVIDCSYESDEIQSSPKTNEAMKPNNTEFETHSHSLNSVGSNMTNNRKCTTNSEEQLGQLEENATSSPQIKPEPEIDSDDHISISDDEADMKPTYPSEDEECFAECDIKIEDNELLVEEQFSESVDDEHCGVPNEMSDNLSNELGAEASSNDSQQFKCNICPYETSDETYFVVHKKTHRNKYRCNACFYVSTSAIKLLHHQRKRHMTLEELLYYCGDCSFSSMKRIELVKHRREEHNIRKPVLEAKFHCPDCSFKCCKKAFYTKHRVKQHKDLIFKCDMCKRVFLDQDDFQVHSLGHTYKKTKEGSYECRACDYRCKNKTAIVYHDRMYHKKTGARDKEFSCELCEYNTSQGWRLEWHMRRHQNREVAKEA